MLDQATVAFNEYFKLLEKNDQSSVIFHTIHGKFRAYEN